MDKIYIKSNSGASDMADSYKKDEDENKYNKKKKLNYLNPSHTQQKLKTSNNYNKKKSTEESDEGEGASGGGGTEGIEFDWNLLAQGQLDCPIGPDEAQQQNIDVLPYSIPLGVRDLTQEKKTYRAQKAETSISKGNKSTQNMYYVESKNQAENGPQANPNPLN